MHKDVVEMRTRCSPFSLLNYQSKTMRMILLWFKLGFASTAAVTAQFSYKDLLLDRYSFSSQVALDSSKPSPSASDYDSGSQITNASPSNMTIMDQFPAMKIQSRDVAKPPRAGGRRCGGGVSERVV